MTNQLRRLNTARQRGQAGFTLIELLVVIIILGVLAGVVVFAVRGTGDKGKSAAFNIDSRTLRTAQETYCGQNGTYAPDDATLVNAKLLSEVGSMNHTVRTNSGPCGGTGFAITCDPANPLCGTDGTTPNGNFDGTAPQGKWTQTGSLPSGSTTSASMATMGNGKVLLFGKAVSPTNPPTVANASQGYLPGPVAVYDPTTKGWTAAPTIPTPTNYPNYPNYNPIFASQTIVLTGGAAECGSHCGKALVMAQVGNTGVARSIGPDYLNQQLYLFDPAAFDAGNNPWTRVPDPPAVLGHGSIMIQVKDCTRASASDCGKVLVTGGLDNNNPCASCDAGGSFDPARYRTSLWDPTVSPLSTSSWSTTDGSGRLVTATSTTSSATVTSPDANFTAADVNKTMLFVPGMPSSPSSPYIQAVVNSTTVTLSATSTAGGTTAAGHAVVGLDLLSAPVSSLSDGRIFAPGLGSALTYSPSSHSWVPGVSPNRQMDLTYTCPSSGTPTVRGHGTLGGFGLTRMSDGRVLAAPSGAGNGLNGNDVCTRPGTGTPPENSTVFNPNSATPWALAPGVCPCMGGRVPGLVTLPSAFGSKVLMVYSIGANRPIRTVNDGVTVGSGTNAQKKVVTSATAAFTAQDVGRAISGAGIPVSSIISSVTNATTVVISPTAGATASATGVALTIGSGWATSALYDGTTWTSIDSSSAPTPRFIDRAGNPMASTGSSNNTGYPFPGVITMLNTGQILLAGGNKCTLAGTACGVSTVQNGVTDTWLYTPAAA